MHEKREIEASEYRERRRHIVETMPNSSIAILPSGIQKFRNADTEFPFRQESNFYYLTGFCEPDSLWVLIKEQAGHSEFILFCAPRDVEREIWVGKRAGIEGAIKEFGATQAYSILDLNSVMPSLLENKQYIFYSMGYDLNWDPRIIGWLNQARVNTRRGGSAPPEWRDLLSLVSEMRLIKSPAEIAVMKKASSISANAHVKLIQQCKPNQMEYELEALFVQQCLSQGCRAMAYPAIVGGGASACTLHYISNDKPLKSGELVLVDAGGEYQYYASDITRTFPVNGRFTPDQKSLYEIVLKAQLAAIDAIKPGISWEKLQETIVQSLVEGLVKLKILQGDVKTLIAEKAYVRFYMHNSGHWLGLDVHDAGGYKKQGEWITLKPGMVLTVEPGVYIAPDQSDVDKRWWGIGIRIEDDVLVTETGYEVLTSAAPKTVEAIENLMNVKNVK